MRNLLFKKFFASLLMITISVTSFSAAAAAFPDTDSGAVEDCQALNDAQMQATAGMLDKYIPPDPASYFGGGSCLDLLLSKRINFMFQMPDLSAILGNLLEGILAEACNMAQKAVSQATGSITERVGVTIPMPYGPSVGIGASVGGSASTSATPTYTPSTTTTRSTVNTGGTTTTTTTTNSTSNTSILRNLFR